MANWAQRAKQYQKEKESNKITQALQEDNLLSRHGRIYDHAHSGETGYTSLSKRWKDLTKRASDYYNNDAFKSFSDSYNGTRNAKGYVGNTGRWYDDLDKQRADANEGIDELLAEIDKYSRYYNDDAVNYLRGLITERQKSYNDIMTDAGKFRDHWSQWKTEDDYNNALLISDAAKAYEAGDYDAAEQMLKKRADKLKAQWGDDWFGLTNSEEYKELVQFQDAITANRNYETQLAEEAKKKAEYEAYDVDAGAAEIEALKKRAQELDAPILIEWMQDLGILGEQGKNRAAEFDRVKNQIAEKQAYYDEATNHQALQKITNGLGGDLYQADKHKEYTLPTVITQKDVDSGKVNRITLAEYNLYGYEGQGESWKFHVNTSQRFTDAVYMSEEEKRVYNTLFFNGEYDKAEEYYKLLKPSLEQKENEKEMGDIEKMVDEIPVIRPLVSLGSVGTSLGSGVEYLGDLAKYAYDSSSDHYGAQMGKNSLAEITNVTRGAVSDEVDWMIGEWDAHDFLYNTAMSGADSAVASLIPGGGVVLGLSAAAQGTNDALERGLSSEQAFWNGAVSGVFEGLFESVSIGKFKSLQDAVVSGGKDIALNIAKSMLVNASEEAATEVANILYDTVVNGALANYTWEELENGAWKDAMLQVAEAAASGALMGIGFGGLGSAISYKATKNEGAKYKSDPGALIEEALRLDPNDQYALSLKAKLESGKNVTQAELGKLSFNEMEATQTALAERDKAAKQTEKQEAEKKINAEKRLAGKIANKNTLSELAQTVTRALTGESVTNAELRHVAKNQAALTLLSKELGLKKDLKVGTATVSDIRNEIKQKQSPAARLSSQNILSVFAAQFDMDESAERSLMVNYAADIKNAQNSKPVNPEEYAAVYGVVYGAGKRGTDISADMGEFTKVLSQTAVAQAYRAGQNAAKNSQNDLQNSTDSDTINTNAQEVQNEQGIHLRDGGERNRGTNPQGQVPGMEGNARQNQSRRKGGAGPRDSEAASLSYDGEEVSAKSLGIENGLESGKVRLVAEGSETASMGEARRIAAKYGLNLTFFGGGNLKIASGQKIISARAYIQGNNVYIRADHPVFTADQLMRHEAGHYMIAKGEVNVADVRKLINERFTPEEIDAISKAYAIAYADTGLTSDEIWEEVICDSLAEMNEFEGREGYEKAAEMAADFLPDLREATLESRKEATGPPKTQEGKASRESREKGADYLIYNFSGKINVDYAEVYISDEELAIIASSIKTGWGALNKSRTLGRVYTSEAYYFFSYNPDNSITIRNGYDMQTDKEYIDMLEEVLKSDKRGKRAISSVGEWLDIVRGRQGRRFDNNGDVSRETVQSGSFNNMDGRSSESDTGRHIESSGEDAQRENKKSFQSPVEAKESGEVNDAHFSIEFAEDIAENQRAYVERGNAAISAEELNKAIEDTAKMVETMKPYAKILPQDKVGKTLVKNGSYDMSVENTTICIRTLAYNSFVDMVSEKVGRPLTQMESFLVSQKLYEIAKEPQCLYCYVSLDRKAFNEMVIRYVDQRDAAIEAYKAAGEPKVPASFDAEWSLFKSFLEGRKPTQNMWDRYVGWINAYKKGDRLVTLSDISTEAKRAKLVEDGGKASAQVVDILKYAQSASWAKKQTQYVAYYDEILKLKPGVIKNLNSHYGMRWYSFSDYSGAFIVENMQQVTDAAIRGLKGLSYTKDTDYAEIFAPTGMNINISVYAMKGKDGYVIDPKQSADIQKAIKLREQYPNVGIVVVATDKAGVEWALAQEWSDVVIPFHTVRTGADVAEFYNWEIFNAEQSDAVSDQNLWDAYVNSVGKKKASKNVYPAEHQNDRDTYLEICRERGLTPRFNSFIDNPNYMKLVNETRQSEAQTQPLKPNFDLGAAERSFDKFVDKGGYYEGWYNDGIDVDNEADIVAEDVRAGKKANEVSYGRQDVDFENLPKTRRDNRTHGKASQDLFEDMNEGDVETDTEAVERELTPREQLAAMLESDDMSPAQKGMLTKYKNKLSKIEANEAEIASLNEELDTLKKNGKGNTAKADVLKKKIRDLEKLNAVSEGIILNLEATKPIKRLLERERRAAYQEGLLAGQMAQGKDTAPALRKTEEELAGKKQSLAELKQKRKDDLDALAKRYQESIQNRTEGRRQTKLRNDIKRVVAELDHLLRHGNKKSNVKLGLQDAVAAALEAFDINAEKIERYNRDMARLDAKIEAATDPMEIEALKALREKKQRNSELLADKLAAMKQAYEDIHNNQDGENYPSYYRAEAKVIMDRISDVIAKVGNVPISEMTSDQLKSVYDMYRVVLTTVRDANKAFIDGKLEDLTENASDMTAELLKIKKLPEERLKAGDSTRGFVWNELTPYYAFKRIGSETLMRYYDELVRGQDVYARDLDEAKRFAENMRKKYNSKSWDRNKVVSFKDKDGRSFKLNLEQMMSIYAYSKREQALDHMERGGFFFNNKETFRTKGGIVEFISSNESGYKLNAETLARIKNALTAQQVAYVDAMQAYLTKMGEKGNEVSRHMWGIDIFNEKVYFPLKSKEDFIYQANTPAETSSLKNDGMTKETKPHASNPIVLESFDEVWANHVNKMSMYHGFVIPIDNLNKLINYGSWIDGDAQSISTMLEARYSSAVNDYLTTFIKDLNGAKAQNGGLLGIMSNWLTKFKKTAVAASLSVVVQQPTAIIRATSEIDPKYFAHLPKKENVKKWDRIQKYAPIAIIKDIGGFDAGSGRQITEWLNSDTRQGVNKAMNKLDDMTMYGAALGDRLGWGAIWSAVEREVQAKQKLKYGTEEFWQACGKRFTDVIVKTQVYDSTLSRSGFMRGKDGLLKMATAFMGEPTLSINMLADAVLQGKRGTMKKRQVARTVAAVYTATIAASVIKSIIYGLRDDDEDESYAEKYMQALGSTVLTDVLLLNMIPILRDVVAIFTGWEVERADMALVQDLYNSIMSLDSEKKSVYRKIEDFGGALAAFAGIPGKNLLRTGREIYNAINDMFDGIEGGDVGGAFIEGVTGKEKSKSQTLYEALIGGEKERIAALRKGYKTDEAYMSAVRTALRKHDPRIKKAAQALYEGDLLTRNEIMLEILREGVFDKTTVDKAIDAEAQAIKDAENKEDTTDKAESGSIYSANDINVAFNYGSHDLAIEIIAELTEIKVAEKVEAARAKAESKGNFFDEEEAREEAEYEVASSLRSTMTKYWKPKYIEAYNAGDSAEMDRIENILYMSALYEYKSSKTLDDVLDEWLEEDEE